MGVSLSTSSPLSVQAVSLKMEAIKKLIGISLKEATCIQIQVEKYELNRMTEKASNASACKYVVSE
jgi:hypothetical protein